MSQCKVIMGKWAARVIDNHQPQREIRENL